MSDTATNRDGSYLKAHAEIETEGTQPPSSFETYWLMFLKHLRKTPGASINASELEHEKFTARTWFEFGAMEERLRR